MGIRDGPAAIRYDLTCHGALGANTVTEQTCFFFPKIISFGARKLQSALYALLLLLLWLYVSLILTCSGSSSSSRPVNRLTYYISTCTLYYIVHNAMLSGWGGGTTVVMVVAAGERENLIFIILLNFAFGISLLDRSSLRRCILFHPSLFLPVQIGCTFQRVLRATD